MSQCLLTTIDNINNPFTHFDEWLEFDKEKNHKTCEILAFYGRTSNALGEEDFEVEYDKAVDRVLQENPSGLYYKLYEHEAETMIPLMNKLYDELKSQGLFD